MQLDVFVELPQAELVQVLYVPLQPGLNNSLAANMLSNNKSSNIQEPPKFIFCYVLLASRLILSLYKIKTAQSYPSFRRTLRRVMKIILLFSLCR